MKHLKGYGYLVDNYKNSEIEIVTWPKQGWREIEVGTGNEAGFTEGSFDTWWEGETLWGEIMLCNIKVSMKIDGKYILGYKNIPKNNIKEKKYSYPKKYIFGT